jgi:serine/threonine protein kinase/Flp pilus assembly protein TadD
MDSERWQRLQTLFHSAYELEEPERSHFLDDACAGDEVLLGQVVLLLSHQEDAKSFIELPALEVAGASLAKHALESGEALDLAGATVAHYQVLERLGAGGMGVVYKARDTRLGRFVGLKFLPRVEPLWPANGVSDNELEDSQAKRFVREAQAASALDHPNICTIYEVGQYKRAPFIAMQFLEGRPLHEEIDGKPSSIAKILQVGVQVADALSAAHKAGIVHGDIKPANIFALADRPEVKILDFGLASVLPAPRAAVGAIVQLQPDAASHGVFWDADFEHIPAVEGTVAYMSPEQVRGEGIDARSDVFSLGVTLYEMATGSVPFAGKSSETVFDAILHETPPAISTLNPQIPRTLERVIGKAIHKDRDSRYQSAAELRDDLLRLQSKWTRSNKSSRLRRSWPIFAAVLLLAASLSTYRYVRWRQSYRFNQNETLVLADFSNTTGDPVFNETLKQALRVQLEQSPFLYVLSERQVSQQLKYMRRPEDQLLTGAVAQEVCTRSGANVLLTGSISSLGSQYVMDINATNCANGSAIASEQSLAASRKDVLHGLVELATSLRGKLGESRTSIDKYGAPVEQATTASLEALQNYSLALKTWYTKGEEAAVPFLVRATELDPEFAMAWARLGSAYDNIGQDTKSTEALSKAYTSRERVSEPERLYIESRYYEMVTHEYQKSLQVEELWQQIYPRDISPYLGTANDYATAGQHLKSLKAETRALQIEPENGFIYANLAFIHINLNQFDRAQEVLDQAKQHNIYNPWFESVRYQLGFLKHDPEQMQRAVAAVADKGSLHSFFLALQADTEAYFGRLSRARELTKSAVEASRRDKDQDSASGFEIAGILREAEFGNRQRALDDVHTVLKGHLAQQSRVLAALALARAGESASALAIVEDLNREHPSDTLLNTYWLPTIRAAVELDRHNPSKAIEHLAPVIPYEMGLQPNPTFLVPYPPYLRGLAYLENGQGAEAAAEFQKIPDHAGLVLNCPLGALAALELGRAYAREAGIIAMDNIERRTLPGPARAQGPEAIAKARKSYEDFLARWKDADPDIPIIREARAEYAKLQ